MRKLSFLMLSLLLIVGVIAGCSSDQRDENSGEVQSQSKEAQPVDNSVNEGKKVDLVKGTETVLTIVQELKQTIETSPQAYSQINAKGKKIEENWDRIEKQVEERYPDDYTNIEESLYPLIAEAKKDQPNVDNLQRLVEETIEKLKHFKEQVSSDS
ncbi:hypothetical protein [Tuberibacillus sp. Marseille-P3662]|uniref:hypothetical protein n=1 Tax=Tuberibacillus sp. Marseille-P3662 TaxID=1965358 RepID=UPI000A1CDD8A|nr:hypothetical protein [Tuberibacillus sp. Marseille-P3662]